MGQGFAAHRSVLGRCHGGLDLLDNLGLLHPNCHRQVYSRGAARMIPDRGESYRELEPCEVKSLTHGSSGAGSPTRGARPRQR